ncbi:MAG TPA: hypothetical protein PK989_13565, partial [Anaerolineales bacterium]|nr:hypothetical protein [Anaerolineales bacterium]
MTTSRISGFYNMTLDERRAKIAEALAPLTPPDLGAWTSGGISADAADHMIENVVGLHSLPLGIALNFMVNGKDVLVPMTLEEPSVVAGASFMAKLARAGGGYQATTTDPLMIGQMQVINVTNLNEAKLKIYEKKAELLAEADSIDPILKKFGGGARDLEVRIFNDSPIGGFQVINVTNLNEAKLKIYEKKAELLAEADSIDPILKKFGGGARDLEVRIFNDSPIGGFLVVHLIYDVRDAMGANAVNTACERLAPKIEAITGGKVHLRILSNLADRRIARARCTIPVKELAFDNFSGEQVRDGIIAAYAFAAVDPYRAATHNKGIMN